jgi:hypothetical protein
MAVKMNHTNGSIFTVDATQQREGNGMITTKSNQSRKSLALLRPTCNIRICLRCPREKVVVAFFNLLERIGVIIAGARCQYFCVMVLRMS